MNLMFDFDPAQYAPALAREGFVHIRKGVSEGFYAILRRQVEEYMATRRMKEFAIGDKQQALYTFPEGGNYYDELLNAVAAVCSLPREKLVLSERHIKTYEDDTDPNPPLHKDRFASEIAVGLSVHVKPGSTLVLYPYDQVWVNTYNSSTELRKGLSSDVYPEALLRSARRVEIQDFPRDVIVFRGHSIWHLRASGAGTTMLYLKLNAFDCDPLGEDPRTPEYRKATEAGLALSDIALATCVPIVGRRVDSIQKRYTRRWEGTNAVALYGEPAFTIDDDEMRALRAMDGRLTLREIVAEMDGAPVDGYRKIRRLARRGIVDLLPTGH